GQDGLGQAVLGSVHGGADLCHGRLTIPCPTTSPAPPARVPEARPPTSAFAPAARRSRGPTAPPAGAGRSPRAGPGAGARWPRPGATAPPAARAAPAAPGRRPAG